MRKIGEERENKRFLVGQISGLVKLPPIRTNSPTLTVRMSIKNMIDRKNNDERHFTISTEDATQK